MKIFTPKVTKTAKVTLIGAFLGDVAIFLAGAYYYNKLTTSQDFRHKLYNYDSRYIDIYYRANERYGDGKVREQDYKEWGITKVESFPYLDQFGFK